ncbi:MAG: type III-B CRISPR module-associated protein Cmr5 [Anaerolinea sp. 4484_236]|nr:MAG: type III-B CRISPR module-associated protein Cmr5 [Anaerolinea sp. 4484_236]
MNTLQQKFATAVHEKVDAYKDEDDSKKYGVMALKLPVLVRTAGLVQALAFVESRGKQPFDDLLRDLAQVVINENADAALLLSRSRTDDLQGYIHLTRRTLTALDWFKRFAQSILNVESTDTVEEN